MFVFFWKIKAFLAMKDSQYLAKKSSFFFIYRQIQCSFTVIWAFWGLFICTFSGQLMAQSSESAYEFTKADPLDTLNDVHFLRPSATFNGSRFWIAGGVGAGLYGTATYGLWKAWYSDYPRSDFKTIDDWPEWLQMDKAGHTFTAYQYSRLAFAGARWTGMKRSRARLTAFGVSTLLQGTLEILDAYSEQWGFSWSDLGANTLGSTFFVAQDLIWREQRILMKMSSDLRPVPNVAIENNNGSLGNLSYVVNERFGTTRSERFLKDYNAQTIWLSANLNAFAPRAGLPPWLNLAVGYGVEDVYGAYGNNWRQNGESFRYEPLRYRQYFLSPDIYFSRIPTKKRWVRLLLGTLDFFKLPAPALEYSKGTFKGKWLMW